MIEIRTEDDGKPVTVNGPHSSEGTRAIAAGIDAAVRMLNYATMPGNDGIVYPATVYSVYGELIAALDKLPQALQQMERWVGEQVSEGAVRENPDYGKHAGDAEAAHATLAGATLAACAQAAKLSEALGRARSAAGGLESVERD
ncbi:hypothetical protein DMB42_52100 [Nonomuraea sp. WAC 01424]|uniref:hypothetical protein n=1 Tax=Nonomuraea sp. WAC 01424 TaxID=2203200 RepID=UPI000F7728D5|nr:hypothetical protein [Nonomuraea sp. WAC 01424]RSM93776.1 hypothetical protein DMB42_52100 [Nonomuraea sp. WAC 01424]